jgi:hypothetical protein
MRHKLSLDENDPKKEKAKTVPPEHKPPFVPEKPGGNIPSNIGSGNTGNTSSAGKIINMTLNVYNTYKVMKEDLQNFEKITEHVVGRINDTMKDALITAQ